MQSKLVRLFQVIGALVAAGVLVVAWIIFNFDRPPFDLALLRELKPGMSQEDVIEILGDPDSDYGNHWVYSRALAWPMVHVRFDDSGRFTESEYDE